MVTVQPKFINPPNFLKQKVGSGGLPKSIILQAEDVIANHDIDFAPFAKKYVDIIKEAMNEIKQTDIRTHDHVALLIYPVMQLKANGGMFGYHLITDVAQSALGFLETIYVLENDAFDILQAHLDTLNTIINNKIRGVAGEEGYSLIEELNKVCARYYKKHDIDPNAL